MGVPLTPEDDAYFAQYAAPPPAPPPPPPPVEQAAPQQESAPPQQAQLAAEDDAYFAQYAAPQPAPEFAPSPSAAVHQDETVPQGGTAGPPPPPPPPPVAATPQPNDPASYANMNPVERTLRENAPPALQGFIPSITEFQNQPTLQDKAGMLVGAANMPFDYGARRQGQRAIDAATQGNPNATLGGTDPGSLIAHPENVLDILPTFASNVPGGGPNELNDWAIANPDKVVPDDPEATYNAWLADTGRTLETGGLAGAAAGLIRGAAVDPSLPISMGLGTAETAATNIARTAPELGGVARGVLTGAELASKGAQFVIDPVGESVVRGAPKVLGKAIPLLAPGRGEAERQSSEAVGEVLQGTAMADREARNAATFTPPPAGSVIPPAGAAVPPAGPVVPPTNGAAPPVGSFLPNTPVAPNGAAGATLAPNPNPYVRQAASPPTAPKITPNGNGAPFGVGGAGKTADNLPLLMNRGSAGWTLPSGKKPNESQFAGAAKRLAEIPPDDFTQFPAGRVTEGKEHQPNKWLAAMTEQGYMLDDWPSSRVGGTAQRREAGQRYINLLATRIANKEFGDAEVKRLIDEFEAGKQFDAANGAPPNRAVASYWDNRAASIIQAADTAKYDKPFQLSTGDKYAGTTNTTPLRGEGFSPQLLPPSADEAIAKTVQYFQNDGMKAQAATDFLHDMLQDPDAFDADHPIFGGKYGIRQELYKSGAWSKTLPSANAPAAKKVAQEAAYRRYQDFRDLHESLYPEALQPPIGATVPGESPVVRAQELPPPGGAAPPPHLPPAPQQPSIPPQQPPMVAQRGKPSLLKRALGQSSMLENRVITTEPPDPRFADLRIPGEWQAMLLGSDITVDGAPMHAEQVLFSNVDEVEELRFLAETNAKTPLTGKNKSTLDALTKKYEKYDPRYDWSEMTDAEASRVAADHTTAMWTASRFPKEVAAGGVKGVGGEVGQLFRDVASFARLGRLTNHAVILRQALQQQFGNTVTDVISGRPSALLKMWDPRDIRAMYRGLQGKAELTSTQKMFERRGLPAAVVGNRSLSKSDGSIQNPVLAKARELLFPERNANIFAVSDGVHGDALERRTFVPTMKKEEKALPQHVVDAHAAFAASPKHDMPSVHPEALRKVAQKAIDYYKLPGEPLSDITPKQLYDALMTEMKKAPDYAPGTPKAAGAEAYADRVARDWSSVNNTARQLARKDRNYVAFTFDKTQLDDVVGAGLFYHYWTTRATGLYAKEMAKKPWMAGMFARLGQQLYQEADENNYPDWLKGYTRVLNSPLGLSMFMSPTDALGTFFWFADWNDQLNGLGASNGDLTMTGQGRTIFPFVINPILDFGAHLFGVYGGEDARIPNNLLGVEPVFSLGAKVLNLLNANGLLPPGMGRDGAGNIVPFGELPITEVLQRVESLVAGRNPVDLGASFKVNTRFFLEDVLREEHPEWATDPQGENKLRDAAIEAEQAFSRGQESPEWVEAERRTIDMEMTGPDFPGIPEPLRGLFRVGSKLVAPIRTTAMPETKSERLYGFNSRDGQSAPPAIGTADDYDTKDIKNRPYDTLDEAVTAQDLEHWYDIGTDTGIQDAARMYGAIGKGEPGTFTIGATTYTNESLKLLSEHQRYQIGEQYLNSQGFTLDDKDAYYQARDEAMRAHPDVAGYLTYKSYVEKDYPGGPKGFVDAAVRTSPSFARYMEQTGKVPGTQEYYDLATTPDAYYAIEGRRSSVYDPTTLPDAGTIPGMAKGETFAMKWALDEAADNAASSSASGDGTSYDDFVADVDKSVNQLYYAQKLLDETYPGAGYQVGAVPKDAYYVMKGVWEQGGVSPPDKGDISYEYRDWLVNNATAPDHSVKSFLNQREQTGPGKSPDMPPVTPEMMAEQAGITLVDSTTTAKLTGTGAIDTTGFPQVTPWGETEARTGPSLNNPMNAYFYAGDVLYVSDRQDGWAQVVGPDGSVGWVPEDALQKAA